MSVVPIEKIQGKQGGGKAKGLALLNSYGCRIPETIVVLDDDPEAVVTYFSKLKEDHQYAVRSSASVEDGSDFSFAGQFKSFLSVQGVEPLQNAIKACFDSVSSLNVASYKEETQTEEGLQMNVIVQQMIQARFSGAIFTADPVRKRQDMACISIVPGLGEALMAGHEEGENHCFFKHSNEMPVSDLLDASTFQKLHEEALKIESLFGAPADLEWAVDEEGTIWWLQLRPITNLPLVHLNELDHRPAKVLRIYTRGNIGEMMPGPVTPLTMSTFGRAIEVGLQVFYKKIGAIDALTDENLFVHSFYNHLFFDMDSLYESTRKVSMSKKENVDYSVVGAVVPDIEIKRENGFFRGMLNFTKMTRFINSAAKARKELKALHDSFSLPLKDDMELQYAEIDKNLQVLFDAYSLHYVTSSQSGALYSAILNIHSKGKVPERKHQEKVAQLFRNIPDVESANVLRSIDEIAVILSKIKNVTADFLETDPTASRSYLAVNGPAEITEGWKRFIERHGHRCVREAEMYEKEWALDPSYVISGIKAKTRLLVDGHQRKLNGYAVGPISLDDNGLNSTQKLIVKQLLPKARKAVARREQTKAYSIGIQYEFKKAYRKLARLMIAQDLISNEDHIFFLTHQEIGKAITDKSSEWDKLAGDRLKIYPDMRELAFQDLSFGIPIPIESEESQKEGTLTGIPVSQGMVEGTVRLVKSLDDVHLLKQDEIMVAQFTDIGWTPYFSIISGLITEIGSPLSHGAVVAREYGLPAIVSMKGAMNSLKTGQKIRLDAVKGEVEILS